MYEFNMNTPITLSNSKMLTRSQKTKKKKKKKLRGYAIKH
jgi:hypothetical protein